MSDATERGTVAAGWAFEVDDSYRLFAFDVDEAVLGERAGPDAWPPRYTRYRANVAG